jgi:hypothetical protein
MTTSRMASSAIRPLEIVTSSVSRWLASPHSPRGDFNTSEEWRAELRRAAEKGLVPQAQDEFSRLFRGVLTQILLGAEANARWR